MLPEQYHIVLDEAYPCTVQEMSPWKGCNLAVEKDASNYYSSLNHQVIERAFGILVQRWGMRPLRVSMHNRGVVVWVACRLHNFEAETDHQQNDARSGFIMYTDGVPCLGRGYRSDLECCSHREMLTNIIREEGLTRPVFSKYNKTVVRT